MPFSYTRVRPQQPRQLSTIFFSTWLPDSEYRLDVRPHFEVLGEKYKNDDPESEEEIWIPIKKE
jgi:AraC family transcriptional regulator